MEAFQKIAAQALSAALERDVSVTEMETPPDPTMGDLAFPCFKLSKELRKAPPAISQEVAAKLNEKPELLGGLSARAVGPYVNFTVPANLLLDQVLSPIANSGDELQFGRVAKDSRETWVVEYSSPNVAKPFMIYHFRPTGLGACIERVGRYRGYKMISINHLGDWGTQFGKLFVAHELFGADLPADPQIDDLVKIYVKLHEAIEKDATIEDRAREAFKRLEQKDPVVTANWKKCIDISMKEFKKLYSRLDVNFDHIWGESHYEGELPTLIANLKKQNILIESEGAWIVNVTDAKGQELPPCILVKKDGSSIYATRDVAAALYRFDQFKFDRMTYVVGGEQKLHFQQVFGVLRRLNAPFVDRCEHVPTGLYRFKDAKMSTRKGNFVTLNEVLSVAEDRVKTLMRERGSDEGLSSEQLDEISSKIALGAVVFHDLHSDPARDVEFDLERVVDFEGETGPYLQYAHTRCLSLMRKAEKEGLKPSLENAKKRLTQDSEIALVRVMGQFPKALERTLDTRKAVPLAHFLVELARSFGTFYRDCQVVSEDRELSEARLELVDATRKLLNEGLRLLGIPRPTQM